jgi:5'-deoxy-5'-methylthioadenosine phosphorylase
MGSVGVIVGSGLSRLQSSGEVYSPNLDVTPYGPASSSLKRHKLAGKNIVVLARHGQKHSIAPHEINYRANIWALKAADANIVISLVTVGGIGQQYGPGVIVIPDQILDYTQNRAHTFFQDHEPVTHIDFTYPFCEELREILIHSAVEANVDVVTTGTYAATQGPRLETSAEVSKLERDGADIVGMTGMPEAALARELGLCYASIALVVNYAAGRGQGVVTGSEINKVYAQRADRLLDILGAAVPKAEQLSYELPDPIHPGSG